MKRVQILGIPIDAVTMHDALRTTLSFLHEGGKHHIATPNNEMILQAQKNVALRTILQNTSLNIPDSMGVLLAARFLGDPISQRVSGADFTEQFCKRLSGKQSIFLLGGKNGVAKKAAKTLQAMNPDLVIAGTYEGSPNEKDAPEIIAQINASDATVLFVAYGVPYQELWIHEYLPSLPSVRVAIGIGGTFDFLAGTIKRAPLWMRRMGLEWLWRLVQQPSRIGRIGNAVVLFPMRVLFSKWFHT